ncbi:MAG: homocysteine S-methyltransferase family protein [Marmoricola sp.]
MSPDAPLPEGLDESRRTCPIPAVSGSRNLRRWVHDNHRTRHRSQPGHRPRHLGLTVLGGCCGTDVRHIRAISDACQD